ncbi:MAG: ABC transporter permease [Armatimonadota bacterium]|nr:ABC transporter permease [Armatimonadota bacterium]MDR7454914.1 ABC transporter permease [Armatimonadota bacterium]MDR7456810.1 ABC transporter permease [Armatimonadota bacterium]MDR7497829.1 ABC transporter permease [Armatimonadota bacterium]MDR7512230.1 ABC transporter permease [Armatimonadota bacterium]
MQRYVATRLAQGVVVIFLVSVGTFGMMHLIPGDPVSLMLGEGRVTQEQIDLIRRKWGLDRPIHEQYLTWMGNMLRGEFGQSVVRSGVPVRTMIAEAARVTITLNLIAFVLSIAVAIPAGIFAAVRRYSTFDYLIMVAATVGVALPNFWVGLMLIVLFSVVLRWLPPYGLGSWHGYVLPVLVIVIGQLALLARLMRSSTLDNLGEDFARTARAKGLREGAVVVRHVVRNALLPIVTVIGYRLAFILSGTIVVETVFALPGLGQLFVESVNRVDYQVVQAIVLLLSVLVVLGNLATDMVYGLIDPRIRIR